MIEVCKRKEILTGEILTGYGWSIKKWLYGLGLEAFFLLLLNEREKSPAGKIIDPSCQRLGQPIRAHDLLRLINSWFWHDFLIWRLIYMSDNFCTGKFAVSWDDVICISGFLCQSYLSIQVKLYLSVDRFTGSWREFFISVAKGRTIRKLMGGRAKYTIWAREN